MVRSVLQALPGLLPNRRRGPVFANGLREACLAVPRGDDPQADPTHLGIPPNIPKWKACHLGIPPKLRVFVLIPRCRVGFWVGLISTYLVIFWGRPPPEGVASTA